jgi:hypothetical protein
MKVTRKPGSTTVIGGTNFCQLVFTDVSTITLNRKNGTAIIINGETCVIPAAGETCLVTDNLITAAGADAGVAPSANTNYYVYRANSASPFSPNRLRLYGSAPTIVNGVSYLGAAGNALNWLYVGFVRVNGSTQFSLVTSHYNPYTSVQIITQTGTTDHTPPPGWTACDILAIPGGAAGGSGAGWDAQAGGGSGGGGSAYSIRHIRPAQVATFLRVVVGPGGTGQAGGIGADGADGLPGGQSFVRDGAAGSYLISANPGAVGRKGTSAIGGASASGSTIGVFAGTASGAGHATSTGGNGTDTASPASGTTGAGGGAGHNGAASATGGSSGYHWIFLNARADSPNPGVDNLFGPGTGGSGGNSNFSGAGAAGKPGGLYGGPGGGGGGGNAASGGGKGGDGAQGVVILTWYF